MKEATFLLAAIGVIGLGLASSRGAARLLRAQPPQETIARAQVRWVFKTDNVAAMTRYADAVIVGAHQRRYAGRTAYSSGGGPALDFELNDFIVTGEPLKDDFNFRTGSNVTVERLKGRSFDGGDFTIGERYLLFLKKQPDTAFYGVVNDEGRYWLGPGDLLNSAADGEVAATLRGKQLDDVHSLIGSLLQQR